LQTHGIKYASYFKGIRQVQLHTAQLGGKRLRFSDKSEFFSLIIRTILHQAKERFMLGYFKLSLVPYIKTFLQAKSAGPAKPAVQALKGYYYHSPGIIKISPNVLSYKSETE